MNKKARTLVGIIFVLIVILITRQWIFNTNLERSRISDNVVKIGVIVPLTGDQAFLGEGFKNAILLAQKDIQKSFGETKHRYEISFQDDSFNPTSAASAAHKFINIDHVNALVSFGSGSGNAVSPIAEEAKTPHLNAIASDSNVAKGDYNFVHWTPPDKEAKLLVDQLKKRSIKNAIIFEQKQAGILAVSDALRKYANEQGISILTLARMGRK